MINENNKRPQQTVRYTLWKRKFPRTFVPGSALPRSERARCKSSR